MYVGKRDRLNCKFLAESKLGRILKIGQRLPKLSTNNIVNVFTHSAFILYIANYKSLNGNVSDVGLHVYLYIVPNVKFILGI